MAVNRSERPGRSGRAAVDLAGAAVPPARRGGRPCPPRAGRAPWASPRAPEATALHGHGVEAEAVGQGRRGVQHVGPVDERWPSHADKYIVYIYAYPPHRRLGPDRPPGGRPAGRGRATGSRSWRPTPSACAGSPAACSEIRRVPPFGADPMAWLDSALASYAEGGFDLLFPTQEQAAVLAAVPDRLRRCRCGHGGPGVRGPGRGSGQGIGAPDAATPSGSPSRAGAVGLDGWDRFPAYVKTPIGTASGGVRRVDSADQLDRGRAPVGRAGGPGGGGRTPGHVPVGVRPGDPGGLPRQPAGGRGCQRRRQPQAQHGLARGPVWMPRGARHRARMARRALGRRHRSTGTAPSSSTSIPGWSNPTTPGTPVWTWWAPW